MNKQSFVWIALIAMLIGGVLFPQQVARAAVGAASFTIAGPLDALGNVKVSETSETELIATGRVGAGGAPLENLDVSGFKQIRVSTGDVTCTANDRLRIFTRETGASTGSGIYTIDTFDICGDARTQTYEVPARTVGMICFCGPQSYVEIAVWGRRN